MKSTMIGRALFGAAASLALTAAGAQENRKHKIDANGDGVVDFSELQALHPELTPEQFNKMDSNSDGQLVHEELIGVRFEKRIARADSDGDGALSFEEVELFHARPSSERFMKFDTDGDGKLTREELDKMLETMRERGPTLIRSRSAPGEDEAATTETTE